MIKIKSWFSKEIQDEYLDEMLLRIGIEEEANTFSDKNDKKKYKERFTNLRMKELDNAEKAEYKLKYLNKKKKENDMIEFLPGKEIDLKTLLIGTREEVFKPDASKKYTEEDMKEYMKLCRFMKKYSSSISSRANFLEYLNSFFHSIVTYQNVGSEFGYDINGNTVTITELKSMKKKDKEKMVPFYRFYFEKANLSPCNITDDTTFDAFQTEVKKATKNLHSPTKDIKYDFISNNMHHRLLSSLHIKCCPYCNRQYITTWTDETKGVNSTADLDHFYQKSTYPLFALSLFNFVPSCQICNSRMKNSNDTETLYPYEEGMDEFRFRCYPKNSSSDDLVDFWLANKTNDPNKLLENYKLELFDNSDDNSDVTHIQRIKGSKEVFHLEEVYQTHLEAAINEMLKIRIYCSGDYSKYAKKTLDDIGLKNENQHNDSATKDDSSNHSESKFSEDEMRDIILGFVYDGQDKLDQPLGKMLSDILENELENKQIYD
ncbi:hypothetical protein RASY3_09405 [Ruminococcus albus SY3]|uniref:HNH nuclease domain-containing protein n=1 Tax=Ruminococcus albus SY3 TaxID=1341156 RepID=A0A011UHX2_RUMAL|nr:hypothetical protein [Ruminococcus albus]EXM40289.1 hypothetical protein RASY3_09405 [Ruminococcus albus SY3]